MKEREEIEICSRCIMDSNIPDIVFDDSGVCNYCHQFDALSKDSPLGTEGETVLNNYIARIRKDGQGKPYDVVIGVSGGVDSMYLVWYACNKGLRPLAVNFDNGWHSEIAVGNIEKCLKALGVNLVTCVVDYDEMKNILLSYMKASLPWIDGPTDLGLIGTLYRQAAAYNIKHIFVGNNFRTEGKQPLYWTYSDMKQLRYIHDTFGNGVRKSFPGISPAGLVNYAFIKRIRMFRPFNYLNYDKREARLFLENNFGWKDYGGHHHESVFTRYAMAVWLYEKFGIDKRRVTFSAQVRSGLISRQEALQLISSEPCADDRKREDVNYVISKLGISREEYLEIWEKKNHLFTDYPSYYPLYSRFRKIFNPVLKGLFPFKPMMSYSLNSSKQNFNSGK